jgi:hypothetical protein
LKVIQQLNGAETDTNRAATPRVNRGIH